MFQAKRAIPSRGHLHRAFWTMGLLVIIGMMVPLLVVIILSFNAGNELVFPPKGISLKWYLNIFKHPVFLSSFQFSMILWGSCDLDLTGHWSLGCPGLNPPQI